MIKQGDFQKTNINIGGAGSIQYPMNAASHMDY